MYVPVIVPDGWGFCSNPNCVCWTSDDRPCEQYVDNGTHPFLRCARCGVPEQFHEPGAE